MKFNILAVTCALSLASFAAAAADNTTFAVTTNVTPACDVSASPLAFADINPLTNASNATDGTSTISVTCSNTTAYDISLDAGQNPGSTVSSRMMRIGTSSDTLAYNLFSDANRTTNWGETVEVDTVADVGTGTSQEHIVYGRIPSGQQTAKVGTYADTIAVQVIY